MSATPRAHELDDLAVEGLRPRLEGQGRVLHADETGLYISRGLEVLHSEGASEQFTTVAHAPASWMQRGASHSELISRLLRIGVHSLTPLPDGSLVATTRGAVLHVAQNESEFQVAHRVTRGKRPLKLCAHPSGRVYFGEYFSNKARSEVHIYGSDRGAAFQVIRTFAAGSIRHIHGIYWDPHRQGLWVLTGDDGNEAGLWWTPDEFQTLEPVLRGTQTARAVTLFMEPSGLIVPMDTPFETNYIHHLDPSSGRLEQLAELPGSVFHSTQSKNLRLLSTVAELSSVNTDPRPAVYMSANGYDWQPIARFQRDLTVLTKKRPYFGWPTVVLPTGQSTGERIYASGQGLRSAHDKLFSWSEGELLGQLKRGEAPIAKAC